MLLLDEESTSLLIFITVTISIIVIFQSLERVINALNSLKNRTFDALKVDREPPPII